MESVEFKPDDQFAQLLAGVRDGDEQSAAELVARFEGIVRRRARRLLGPALRVHLDSVDIAQSVNRTLLIGLRRAAFSISTPEELTRLALTLVRRKVARHWRKRKREAECRCAGDHLERVAAEAYNGQPSSDVEGTTEFNETVRQVLDQLDGLDRQLMELRLEGHTTAEAARIMGVSPGLLRSRLSRLRKRFWDQGLWPDAI